MNYTNVKNPKWANFSKTVIDCEVNFDAIAEEFVPFTAVASGDLPHTHEIFARCVAGEFGPVAEYTPPPDIVGEEALVKVRAERDGKLTAEVDPVVSNPLRWAAMASVQQQAWADYRNALLDITSTCPNPSFVWNEDKHGYDEVGITWPVKPE